MEVFEYLWKYSIKLSHLNEHLFNINDFPFKGCGLLKDSVSIGCEIIEESCCVKHVGGRG